MLQLRAYVPPEQAESIQQQLTAVAGVRHVIVGGRTAGDLTQLTGELDVDAADVVLELLRQSGLAAEDVVLWRTTRIQPLGWRRRRTSFGRDSAVWAEITGRAAQHARTALAYVLFMAAAGVVAGVGLAIAGLTAAGVTILLRVFGRIDPSLELADSVLGPSLTEIGPGTVLVALAAGMAGMLAYETAGGSAVGVAISVTTIPAAAYIGCAVGLGTDDGGFGALEVLAMNLVCIMAGSTLTLLVQQRWRRSAANAGSIQS